MGMLAICLAVPAEIIIITFFTLVALADQRAHFAPITGDPGPNTFLDSSETLSKISDDNFYDHGSFKIVDINQILKKETSLKESNFQNESHTIDGMGYVGNSIS